MSTQNRFILWITYIFYFTYSWLSLKVLNKHKNIQLKMSGYKDWKLVKKQSTLIKKSYKKKKTLKNLQHNYWSRTLLLDAVWWWKGLLHSTLVNICNNVLWVSRRKLLNLRKIICTRVCGRDNGPKKQAISEEKVSIQLAHLLH